MKTLTQRSAILAACTALLLAGTAVQASANDTDHSTTPGSVTNNGDSNIIVIGNNNNAAGNDLIVGNNNTSGTGHTIGTGDLTPERNCLTIRNNTNITVDTGSAYALGAATVTRPPASELAAGQQTTVCSAANSGVGQDLTMVVSYHLPGGLRPESDVSFTIVNDTLTGDCAYVSDPPAQPWQAQAVCQENTEVYSQGYATIG
ncbi:hypothetical protein AB0D37_44390 [Streptomyces sp. NPDC048384]|uniref:hypothetical protein n=1 Tax=Streptomyces sp. NPDC048384 TaxID=3155487 RepID=UPI00342CBA45